MRLQLRASPCGTQSHPIPPYTEVHARTPIFRSYYCSAGTYALGDVLSATNTA